MKCLEPAQLDKAKTKNAKPNTRTITFVNVTRNSPLFKQLPRKIGKVDCLQKWAFCKGKAFCNPRTEAKN